MLHKDFIKIVNEEISDFDFLSIDEMHENDDILNKIKSIEFQKQLVSDVLNRKDNLNFDVKDTCFNEDSYDNSYKFSFIYFVGIEYKYDTNENPINLSIDFTGDNIDVKLYDDSFKGNYHTPPDYTKHITNIEWLDVDVKLYYDGSNIEFKAYYEAPNKIKELFIREFIEDFLLNEIGYQYR